MNTELGVLLALAGGVMVGNCMVPLNYLRTWRWENAWIVFSVVALLVLPWSFAFLWVPDLLAVYGQVNGSDFVMPFLYGAGWGVAQVLFGLAVVRIGMALSFAITIGLSAALGTIVPILFKDPHVLATGRGSVLLLGLLLMVTGVAACSWAGHQREGARSDRTEHSEQRSSLAGIFMAAAAGLLAPMLNYSLAFGGILIQEAIRHHAKVADAPYAVWPVALAGGAVPNLAYAIFLANRNKSWGKFVPAWPDMLLGSIMGVLWMGSMAIYGMATTFLGLLGASVGWSIFQICIILTANISGWLSGEWKGANLQLRAVLWCGLILLGSATLAIAYGTRG
jgi:L-rhamnose-H+ transport protein